MKTNDASPGEGRVIRALLPGLFRSAVESRLPPQVEPLWYDGYPDTRDTVEQAEVLWVAFPHNRVRDLLLRAPRLRWIAMYEAGVEQMPLELIRARRIVLTSGAGVSAIPVAEFALMGMLALAKGLRGLLTAQESKRWLEEPTGYAELYDSRALIVGYGHIGRAIGERLSAFGVNVTPVRHRRTAEERALGPSDWRSELNTADWIVLAAPQTPRTFRMIGRREFEQLKEGARLVNVARGGLIDQAALIEALQSGRLAGAFLDVADSEPLDAEDPIWSAPNLIVTPHVSSGSTRRLAERATQLFLENLARLRQGLPLENVVDFEWAY